MGNKSDKIKLSKEDIKTYTLQTHCILICILSIVDYDEILTLYSIFLKYSKIYNNIEYIDKENFQIILGIHSAVINERLFSVVDSDRDRLINFTDFIMCLSSLSHKAFVEEKINCIFLIIFNFDLDSFRFYDVNDDGKLSKEELSELIQATFLDNNLNFSPKQINDIVESSFQSVDLNNDGFIDYEEYSTWFRKILPDIEYFTLNIHGELAKISLGIESF